MARELADTISFILLIQLFFISILLCIMGFQFLIALKVKDTAMMTQSLVVQSAFLTQLMMYSFIGNYLKTQMEEVALSIYQSVWYEFPAKITKNLIFIFMQTDSPVTFQAGNFITVVVTILPLIELCMDCSHTAQTGVLFYLMDCVRISCTGIIGMMKIIWFRIYANNLTNNYESALNDYSTTENVKERSIMRKHAFVSRIISLPTLLFSYTCCMVYTILPFMKQNATNDDMMEYPLPSECTMKYVMEYFRASIIMYKLSVIIQALSLLTMVNANIGGDALFMNITLHICGQIKILKARFANMDVTCPQIYDRFEKLIKRHIYLIEMTRQLVDVINFVLLIELFFISISIGIMGFQFLIAMKNKDILLMEQSLMSQSIILIKLSMYSFVGNYLKSQMEDISRSIYQSAWYELPTKLTRNLVFIFMQAEAPVTFQAGNFIEVNLSTLVNILKTSFSYLSVLRIMLDT